MEIQENQIQAEVFLNYFNLGVDGKFRKKMDCPPKLSMSKSEGDDYFIQLEALLIGDSILQDQLFDLMMENDCRYYNNSIIMEEVFLQDLELDPLLEALAMVQSSANPNLRLREDKAGMWQLNYVLAKRNHLRIDSLIDERFDIQRSTIVAKLQWEFLMDYFDQNVTESLIAFMKSSAYVKRLKKRYKYKNDNELLAILDDDLRFKLNYLLSWHEWSYNFKSSKSKDLQQKITKGYRAVAIKDRIRITYLSEFLGISEELIRSINPVFVGDFADADEKHAFYLPKDKASFIEAHYQGFLIYCNNKEVERNKKIKEEKERLASGIPDPEKYTSVIYKVKSGDVLGLIAQRHNVKVSDIKKWNDLYSDRINIGQELTIYVPKGAATEAEAEALVKKEKKEPQIEAKTPDGSYITYVVKNGDSLWLIARKYPGVSAENIMEWNGINDKISPGQSLKIYLEP